MPLHSPLSVPSHAASLLRPALTYAWSSSHACSASCSTVWLGRERGRGTVAWPWRCASHGCWSAACARCVKGRISGSAFSKQRKGATAVPNREGTESVHRSPCVLSPHVSPLRFHHASQRKCIGCKPRDDANSGNHERGPSDLDPRVGCIPLVSFAKKTPASQQIFAPRSFSLLFFQAISPQPGWCHRAAPAEHHLRRAKGKRGAEAPPPPTNTAEYTHRRPPSSPRNRNNHHRYSSGRG
jgi:hypothetical protein